MGKPCLRFISHTISKCSGRKAQETDKCLRHPCDSFKTRINFDDVVRRSNTLHRCHVNKLSRSLLHCSVNWLWGVRLVASDWGFTNKVGLSWCGTTNHHVNNSQTSWSGDQRGPPTNAYVMLMIHEQACRGGTTHRDRNAESQSYGNFNNPHAWHKAKTIWYLAATKTNSWGLRWLILDWWTYEKNQCDTMITLKQLIAGRLYFKVWMWIETERD